MVSCRVVEMECLEQLLNLADDMVRMFFGRFAEALGDTVDSDAVLVRAGEKGRFVAALPFVASQAISDNGRIETAEVRFGVGVVDGGGNVEGLHRCECSLAGQTGQRCFQSVPDLTRKIDE